MRLFRFRKNTKLLLAMFIFVLTCLGFVVSLTRATNCPATDYDCQIAEIQREIDALTPAQEYNKKELSDLNSQVESLGARILSISVALEENSVDIQKREEDLSFASEIFQEKTKNYYKFIRLYDPLMPFLSSENASNFFREMSFRAKAADEDIKTMESYAEDLLQLKIDKENLENNQKNLSALKTQLAERAKFLEGEVEKTDKYLSSLSARQNELAALKAGGFQTSVGDTPATLVPCSGAPGSANYCNPGFRPAFAFFSFGAPHRTGMSQYGAYGRAKSGQNAETILSAYYQGAILNKAYPVPDTIGVSGIGRVSFEDNYLLGIYEVPESWGDNGGFEALKAQAVAARTYALAVTNNGSGTICTTESCQVYKPQLKSGKWAEAVRATRGWVLEKNGSPAKSYYASTSGGYTLTKWGWSGIKDASGAWPATAYEQTGGSPWFYMAWFKSRGGATCGRSDPWLTSEEMADIINAWEVLHNGASGDRSRVSPIDTSCWGGNPYTVSELQSIGGHKSVSSVSVVYGNDGSTLSVSFSTNKSTVNIPGWQLSDGSEGAVNLRAPGYIGLKSSLFNVEKL